MSFEKTASYLRHLNEDAFKKYCEIRNVNPLTIDAAVIDKPSDVEDCLCAFLEEGITPLYVIQDKPVWVSYIKSLVDERYHDGVDMTIMSGLPADFLYFSRACYRMGFSMFEDTTYDVIEKIYIMAYPALEFLNAQTYDDDVYNAIVKEAIRVSGVRNNGRSGAKALSELKLTDNAAYNDLNTEKSTSIRPVVDPAEAFEFWKNAPMCDVHFSLKIDGVNTKMAFAKNKGLELALSRGRSADSIDYTDAIRAFIQTHGIDAISLDGRVTGESFVGLKDLQIVASHYPDKNYKTPKSTAMAMLRSPHNFEASDLKYLNCLAFDYNGLAPNIAFDILEKAGFATPPAIVFSGESIPRTSLEEFNEWMEMNVLKPMFIKGSELGIGSDGVVMYLLADINTERKDKYSDKNIAIKYGPWAAATYTSRVTGFAFDQRRVEASIVLEIEPCVTRDMNTATRVGIGSPDILIRDDVRIGDTIEFERKSEAYNVYLRKKE